MSTNDDYRQMQIPDHLNWKDRQYVYVPITKSERVKPNKNHGHDDGLWIVTADNYIEAEHRKDLNECEVAYNKYLNKLTDNQERTNLWSLNDTTQGQDIQSRKDLSDSQKDERSEQEIETRHDITVDRMNKLKGEIRYLERGMQRLKKHLLDCS